MEMLEVPHGSHQAFILVGFLAHATSLAADELICQDLQLVGFVYQSLTTWSVNAA